MAKKAKLTKTDGLGAYEIKKIRGAIRLVWHRCLARALVVKRCTGKGGFTYCEKCKKKTPKLKIDHITQVGDVDGGFIARLFCPSSGLQGLCHECHKVKTREERRQAKMKAKAKELVDKAIARAKSPTGVSDDTPPVQLDFTDTF